MRQPPEFGVPLYELATAGTFVAPLVLASSAPVHDGLAYESLKDAYFGMFEVLVAQLSGTIGEPSFNDGTGHRRYPAKYPRYAFLATWNHGGVERFLALRTDDTEKVCAIVIGTKSSG